MRTTERVKRASADGGGWLAIIAVVLSLAAFLVVLPEGGIDTTPTESDAPRNVAFSPTGEEMEISCNEGWAPVAADDVELVVLSCTDGDPANPVAGDWYVFLNEDGTFNYALQIDTLGDIVEVEADVPGWLP